ncbi:MAG: HRDC domain-containing protein [Pseudomonadota bacterium]
MPPAYQLVDTQLDLDTLAATLSTVPWVAVDTEFMRESTYYPELCLLQLATADWCALVDPLADVDLTALWEALYRPELRTVFHAASQDLELFTLHRGAPPSAVFDTQVAAPLLGHAEGIGYARLVEAVTGVALPKDQTRADWSARPLSDSALRYAANDVVYLAQIYPEMSAALERAGRLDWLAPEWAALGDVERYRRPPDAVAQRLKGIDRFNPPQQARAQALAIWREAEAQAANLPRGWVLSDQALNALARKNPTDARALARLRDLKPATVSSHGTALLRVLREAPDAPRYPVKRRRKSADSLAQRCLLDALAAHVSVIALARQIHPDALASRAQLASWLENGDGGFDTAWRDALLDAPLRAVLRGSVLLQVRDGAVSAVDAQGGASG